MNQTLSLSLTLAAVAVVLLAAFSGGAAAHDDGDGLTVHNQTVPLDEHGEIHTLTIDRASADTDYYVDVHTDNGTINTTQTFDAGTTQENFQITLDPTITTDTEATVAVHAANGTELAAETISVDVVETPTVSFSDQVHQLDEHDEIHHITVDTAAANQDYYVDIHTANGTINTTQTFDAGTAQTDLELTLDPTLTETTNVTAAVHAENGTELAAETATVATADAAFSNQTHELDEHDEVHHITVDRVSAGVPYYVDVHTANGTINTTQTFDAGTTTEDLELTLDPTITADTEVTVALHTENGTEIAAQTATVSTADVAFSNQSHELDEHGEIHHITVDEVSAGVPYYVDVHTANGTINTTQTFSAGTTTEDLELTLDPTITSDTEVTVALHTEDGTEIAAQTATVRVTESQQTETETVTATESTETETATDTATETSTGGSGPGFGVAAAIAALIAAALVGQYGRR